MPACQYWGLIRFLFISPIARTVLVYPPFAQYIESTSSEMLFSRDGLMCELCVTRGYWFQAARTTLEISVWNHSSQSASHSRRQTLSFGRLASTLARSIVLSLSRGRKARSKFAVVVNGGVEDEVPDRGMALRLGLLPQMSNLESGQRI